MWPKLPYHFSFEDDDDVVAMYGDKAWAISDFSDGPSQLTSRFEPNGAFTIKRENGSYRYSNVSDALFCHPDIVDKPLKVYHNLFAKRPLEVDAFEGIAQGTFDQATWKEQWLN